MIAVFMILISITTFYLHHILQIKVVLAFLWGIFYIISLLCSGYNAHLILSAVKSRHGKITVILNNIECYTSFTINDVTFIDSCKFMLSSFDKLSSKLSKDQFRETIKYFEQLYVQEPNQPQTNNVTEGEEEDKAMHVHEEYRNHPYQSPTLMSDQQQQIEEDLALMTRKGVYPYEYMDSFEQFQEPQLPPKDAFYNSLTEEDISEIDYTHAKKVFNHFDITDLGDYHNLYLLTNVLLVDEVFDNFRDVCLQHFCLDPAHNYTFPGLFWQTALKMTGVELDLLTDID